MSPVAGGGTYPVYSNRKAFLRDAVTMCITGYLDLQGWGCKQSAYDSITQRTDEPLRSYIMRYRRLFKLLNGTAPDDVRMRTTSMHFVNSLRNYLSSKVENRLLGMNEKNYSLGETFKVALECELKAIASGR